MSGFTGTHEIRVLDALTTIVMVEQCPPDETVVTFYDTTLSFELGRQHTLCLACLLKTKARNSAVDDGRGALVHAVKNGNVLITAAGPRSDTWRCPRCEYLFTPRPRK